MMDIYTRACLYAYQCIANNKYYFTFEARSHPEEEEFGHLGFIVPYFSEVNPSRPLGRPLNHDEDPRKLLRIPTLLPDNCLDEDQYPWNILLAGPDSVEWHLVRYTLYEQFNVAAYKNRRSEEPVEQKPSTQIAMSTVAGTALQTSYPYVRCTCVSSLTELV